MKVKLKSVVPCRQDETCHNTFWVGLENFRFYWQDDPKDAYIFDYEVGKALLILLKKDEKLESLRENDRYFLVFDHEELV
jgi:hypothetical protein